MTPAARHNLKLSLIAKLLLVDETEAQSWIILESAICAVGAMHGRNARQIAEILDVISERIVVDDRAIPERKTA